MENGYKEGTERRRADDEGKEENYGTWRNLRRPSKIVHHGLLHKV